MKNCALCAWLLLLLSPIMSIGQVFYGNDAQQKVAGADIVRIDQTTQNPSYIRFSTGNEIQYSDIISWINQSFKVSPDLSPELISTETDKIGMVHYRFRQTYKSTPVEGADFIVHTLSGKVVSINGTILSEISITNNIALSVEQSRDKAIDYTGASTYMWQSAGDEAWLKNYKGKADASYYPAGSLELIMTGSNVYSYVWKFDIYAKEPLSRKDVLVDATSGNVVKTYDKLHMSDANGTAVTAYSSPPNRAIITDSLSPTQFRLRESGRGDGVETYNLQEGTNYGAAVDFTDADNFWNNVNANKDQYATDAHWGAEMTYDYFYLIHGRNSIDANGFALLSYVHYSSNFDNAFWDGQRMTYGDGDFYSPFTTLDICGHEVTHGLTEFTANLIYADESGALSEGYSDIFGTAIEFYALGASGDWLEGEDLGSALRDIANPNNTQNPDTYQGDNWDFAQEVHQNSTVLSHWFYLSTMGGSGTNDIGDAFSVTAMGINDAEDVAFRTLTVYLSASSNYEDARFYSIVSASDLFGGCTPQVEAVTDAWYAVGVGSAYVPNVVADFDANGTTFCSVPATIQFVNQTTNGTTYTWYFGDGGSSTQQNPSHAYAALGDYDVKLVSDGGTCGIDSITQIAFISIDPGNSNTASLPTSGTGAALNCCTGTLFDSGGLDNYTDNTNGVITIAPIGASSVTVNFSSFSFESGWDYLYIYDGPNALSPVIGVYDGNSLPNGGTILSTGGAITFRQTTDQGVVASGFELTWQCNMPNSAPITNFIADQTNSCTGIIQFTDQSVNGPVSWTWDFGDGTNSILQHPIHAYLTSGTFNVKLTTTNAFGADSLIRSSYITVNLPVAPITTDGSTVGPGTVTLYATGVGLLDWFDVAIGGTSINTGTSYTTPVISTTTTYYVEDQIIGTSIYGGKTTNSGSGGYFGSSGNVHYLIFDCLSEMTIVSVKVYAQGAGNRTILLRNSSGTLLETLTVNIPDGESRVTLNFDVPVGTDFELVCDGSPDLYRNNNGAATYPYTTPGMFSITESSASRPPYNVYGNYYYFYDWEVKPPTCISARVPVTAFVYYGIGENSSLHNVTVYPNPADDYFTLTFTSENNADFLGQINDVLGKTVSSFTFTSAAGINTQRIDISNLAPGVYFFSLNGTEGELVRKIVVE